MYHKILIVSFLMIFCVCLSVNANPCLKELHPKTTDNISYFSICKHSYFSAFNPITKTPKFVVELVDFNNFKNDSNDEKIRFRFKKDLNLPMEISPSPDDYTNSGYSRGHLAPAGNYRYNSVERYDTYFMSNVIPQVQRCNNSGVWLKIENHIRSLARSGLTLYVISGPIYDPYHTYISNGIEIPDMLFKVVYNKETNKIISSYLVPNVELCNLQIMDVTISPEIIQELTGLIFP